MQEVRLRITTLKRAGSQQPPLKIHEEIITLEPGKPIERELAGGQRHKYQIVLSEGQYMKVEIKEKGISVGRNARAGRRHDDQSVGAIWRRAGSKSDRPGSRIAG